MLRSMSRLSGVALGLCLTLAISTNAALAAATHGALAPKPPLAAPPDEATAAHFRNMDHIVVVLMENQSFDNLVGRNRVDSSGNILEPDTPFITSLAETQGVATLYFGVTHPSLPNYLAAVAGDYFGVQDDNPSCYAQPAQSPCDTAPGLNLVDTLEGKGLTWTALMQSMPSAGFLGPRYPASGPTLYAQKHNPFVYFNSVASNPVRLAKIVPLTDLSLSQTVAHLPNFTFIVPDQCNDMHGTSTCSDFDGLLKAGDAMVKKLTFAVLNSPSFTRKSALFIVWDEDDYSSNLGCCDSLPSLGGGHTLALVMTKKTNPRRSAVPINHYSLLRTIEEGFGLPYLGNSGDPINVPSMFPLL